MRVIEPLLKVEDIMQLFHVSRVSVYRWIALSRKGEGTFPLPVFGRKQRLCWNRADVERFCQTQPATHAVMQSPAKQTKAVTKSRQERRANTEAILAGHGININKGGTNE
jgi:predicted DNA-binding transcriptional regulator AlpA